MFRPAYCSLYFLCSQERERGKTHSFFFSFHCNKNAPNKIQSITFRLCSAPPQWSAVFTDNKWSQSRFLTFPWTLWEPEPCSSRGSCACPPPQKVLVNLGEPFLVFEPSDYWLVDNPELYLVMSNRCAPRHNTPSWKNTARAQLKDMGSCPIEKHPTVWTSWLGR